MLYFSDRNFQKTYSIIQFQLYEDIFEKPFLAATGDYYNSEASKLLQDESISIYMEKVIQRIENENKRSRKFLYPSSFQKVNIIYRACNICP